MTHIQRKFNIYNLIKKAISHQWDVVLSSDGYANYGTGNVLTSDSYGAHGFSNPNAWCVLSKNINNQQYQFCLQTDGYLGLRLKYSKIGFTNGMDNLGASPTATDQEMLVGSGTDIAPDYQQFTAGFFQFNTSSVMIKILTNTNELNFSLRPMQKPITPTKPKKVINKVLT